jgi:hypothetical protein
VAPVAVGFAAAIVGAGLTTVLYSALHSNRMIHTAPQSWVSDPPSGQVS